jgi:hypothetical protein
MEAGNVEEGGGEVTLTAVNGKLVLDSGEYSDVELVATDGERISAHRNIIAAHSKFFGTLLLGHFSESSSSTFLQIGYEGDILRSTIVKYCYTTDKVSLVPEEASENNESSSFETKQAPPPNP